VLRASQRRDVRMLSTAAADLLSRHAPGELRDTIAAAPRLTADAGAVAAAARGSRQTELRDAVGSLAHVASAIAEQSPALGASLESVNRTSTALMTAGGAPLDRTLASLPATATALRSGATAASAILAGLDRLVPQLQPGVSQLAPTLRTIRPLLRKAAPAMVALNPALAEAQTAVAGAQRGAAPATAAIRALEPTLQIFQRTLLSALEQPTNLGDPAYLAFLGLFAGGGGASRPFGVDGQGHFMRFGLRFLTGVGLPLPPCTLLNQVSPPLTTVLEKYGGCTP
jgi:ABC-type transporter Mla subunit MlaD